MASSARPGDDPASHNPSPTDTRRPSQYDPLDRQDDRALENPSPQLVQQLASVQRLQEGGLLPSNLLSPVLLHIISLTAGPTLLTLSSSFSRFFAKSCCASEQSPSRDCRISSSRICVAAKPTCITIAHYRHRPWSCQSHTQATHCAPYFHQCPDPSPGRGLLS